MKKLFQILALIVGIALATACSAGQLLPYPKFKATDSAGVPYSGGKLYTYQAGTSTAKYAYTDVNLSTVAANPIILDSSGEAAVYLKGKYKLVLKTSADVTVWTLDNVQGMGDWEEGKYYVDASETDQGVTGAGNSIAAHLSTIGSDNAILKLANSSGSATTSYTVSTAITIPANVKLEIEPGALLVKGSGSPTLTINGTLYSTLKQIFSGWVAGNIAFGAGSVTDIYPEWWGADPAGTADSTTAFDCAISAASASVSSGKVKTSRGSFKVGNLTAISSPVVIDLSESTLKPVATGIMFDINYNSALTNERVIIKNAKFQAGTANPANLVKVTSGSNVFLDNFNVSGLTLTHSAIWNLAAYGLTIKDSIFHTNTPTRAAIYLSRNSGGTQFSYKVTMDNIDISNNTGVGIKLEGGLVVGIKNSVIESCSGGGISIDVATPQTYLIGFSIDNTYFEGNTGFDISVTDDATYYVTGAVKNSIFVTPAGITGSSVLGASKWLFENNFASGGIQTVTVGDSGSSEILMKGNTGFATSGDTYKNEMGKVFSLSGTSAQSLNYPINSFSGGGAALALCSLNDSTGAATRTALYLLKFGYDGNNVTAALISKIDNGGSSGDQWTFGNSGVNLTVTCAVNTNYKVTLFPMR